MSVTKIRLFCNGIRSNTLDTAFRRHFLSFCFKGNSCNPQSFSASFSAVGAAAGLPITRIHQSQLKTQYTSSVRYAGHAKWQNIKHVKEANDAHKQAFRNKLAFSIKTAIREGGGSTDPKLNKKLADVIEIARKSQVPLENIQRLLSDNKEGKERKVTQYGIKGPAQSVFIVEVETDNTNRCKQELNAIIKKKQFTLAESISTLLYQFKHTGVILCSEYHGKPVTNEHLDEAVAHAIEAGAEDVRLRNDEEYGIVLEFNTDPAPNNFYPTVTALANLSYKVVYNELEFLPLTPVSVSEDNFETISNVCQKLLGHPDVVKLYDNIA